MMAAINNVAQLIMAQLIMVQLIMAQLMDVFNACRIRKDSSIGSRGPSEARPSEKGEKK